MKLNRPRGASSALSVVRLAASIMAVLILAASCVDQTDVAAESEVLLAKAGHVSTPPAFTPSPPVVFATAMTTTTAPAPATQ